MSCKSFVHYIFISITFLLYCYCSLVFFSEYFQSPVGLIHECKACRYGGLTLYTYYLICFFGKLRLIQVWYQKWFYRNRIVRMRFLNWFWGFWNWFFNKIRLNGANKSISGSKESTRVHVVMWQYRYAKCLNWILQIKYL